MFLQNPFLRYTVDEDGKAEKKYGGVYLLFDRHVSVTETELSVNFMTLITRAGGIIGVGKEFLWMILFVLTHCVTFYKYVIPYLI